MDVVVLNDCNELLINRKWELCTSSVWGDGPPLSCTFVIVGRPVDENGAAVINLEKGGKLLALSSLSCSTGVSEATENN